MIKLVNMIRIKENWKMLLKNLIVIEKITNLCQLDINNKLMKAQRK